MAESTEPGIIKVIEKALEDPAYATLLKSNPQQALQQLGIQSSPAKQTALKELSSCIDNAHKQFGGQRPD